MNSGAINDRLTEEVERLLAENARLLAEKQQDVGIWIKAERDYQATIAVFRAEEAKLKAALKPFAEFGVVMLPLHKGDTSLWATCPDEAPVKNISAAGITVGDFRRAARAQEKTDV